MAEAFREKRERGEVHGHGSGFGGSGFKFDAAEADHRKAERKVRPKPYCICSAMKGFRGRLLPLFTVSTENSTRDV